VTQKVEGKIGTCKETSRPERKRGVRFRTYLDSFLQGRNNELASIRIMRHTLHEGTPRLFLITRLAEKWLVAGEEKRATKHIGKDKC
ncbi:MAG TPA: hypothetical protein VIC28_01455, partial [Thermoanaerobaculia bacterium]